MLGRLRRSGGRDSDAMYARGYQYSNETDPPDLDAARGWYEWAANAGHVDAMYALGALHSDLTQPPNLEAARHWFERAANAGHVDAVYNLGFLYAQSMTPPDLHAAPGCYERAAAAGNGDALFGLGRLCAASKPPDPDLTRALRALIDDANEMSWAERELADPPTPRQREMMPSRFGDLVSVHAAASIYERDGDILESAGRG